MYDQQLIKGNRLVFIVILFASKNKQVPDERPKLFLGIKLWKCSRKHYNECYRSVHFAHQIMKNVIDRFQLDYLHLTTEPLATDVLDDGL